MVAQPIQILSLAAKFEILFFISANNGLMGFLILPYHLISYFDLNYSPQLDIFTVCE